MSRAHLFWAGFALAVAGIYLALHASMGTFITVAGVAITPVVLGDAGAMCLAGSAAYTLRKRLFIGGRGDLAAWLWSHVYLGLLGLLFIWYHSRQRFSPDEWLPNAAMLLLITTGLTGLLGRALYALVPRVLMRLSDYDPPQRLQDRIAALQLEASSFATLKSDAFVTAYRRLLARPPVSAAQSDPQVARDRVALQPDEGTDFERMLAVLARRGELLRTLRRRQRVRGMLDLWWKVHMRLTEAGLLLATMHILAAVLIDHRWR